MWPHGSTPRMLQQWATEGSRLQLQEPLQQLQQQRQLQQRATQGRRLQL